MDEETRGHKERLLAIYQENLREMEIRDAQFGLNTPLHIINEIKYHRKNIEELRLELQTNAQEVSFDKLLVGIEELQRIIRGEGKRAIQEYNKAFTGQGLLGLGLMAPLSGGVFATRGLAHLYQEHVRGIHFTDQHNIMSTVIYAVGIPLSVYLTFRLGKTISDSKRDWFVYRMGYDPFDHESRS